MKKTHEPCKVGSPYGCVFASTCSSKDVVQKRRCNQCRFYKWADLATGDCVGNRPMLVKKRRWFKVYYVSEWPTVPWCYSGCGSFKDKENRGG